MLIPHVQGPGCPRDFVPARRTRGGSPDGFRGCRAERKRRRTQSGASNSPVLADARKTGVPTSRDRGCRSRRTARDSTLLWRTKQAAAHEVRQVGLEEVAIDPGAGDGRADEPLERIPAVEARHPSNRADGIVGDAHREEREQGGHEVLAVVEASPGTGDSACPAVSARTRSSPTRKSCPASCADATPTSSSPAPNPLSRCLIGPTATSGNPITSQPVQQPRTRPHARLPKPPRILLTTLYGHGKPVGFSCQTGGSGGPATG